MKLFLINNYSNYNMKNYNNYEKNIKLRNFNIKNGVLICLFIFSEVISFVCFALFSTPTTFYVVKKYTRVFFSVPTLKFCSLLKNALKSKVNKKIPLKIIN